jgi:hypothetical protein
VNYREYRKRKARRRTYDYWNDLENALLLLAGCFGFVLLAMLPVILGS